MGLMRANEACERANRLRSCVHTGRGPIASTLLAPRLHLSPRILPQVSSQGKVQRQLNCLALLCILSGSDPVTHISAIRPLLVALLAVHSQIIFGPAEKKSVEISDFSA